MNGDDRIADHETRITRLEVTVEYIVKRLDDLERRMEAGFREVFAEFRELRREMRWMFGLMLSIMCSSSDLIVQ
jgi:tetrahydromethanopterin S-methyltransferase subunit G